MPRAKLSIELPDQVWVGALSRAHPETTFRVLSAMPADETGVGLVEVIGPGVDSVVEAVADRPDVVSTAALQRTDERAVIQFETTQPMLLFSLRESGAPLELPMEIRDGRAEVDVAASADRISALGDKLTQFGLSYDLRSLARSPEPPEVLTDRQRDLLMRAIEAGYYDTPRGCSLTELAETVGMAKSTVSEVLHRAEGKALKEFAAERYGYDPREGD
jgi:hypothetical protein